jgi:transcriptional regulator with XRE-family HTH domain
MNSWFRETPESARALSEERLILASTELVHQALDLSGLSKKDLAQRLGVSQSEIGQRLSGRRNLTVRSLAALLHELGYEATLTLRPLTPAVDLLAIDERAEPRPPVHGKHIVEVRETRVDA